MTPAMSAIAERVARKHRMPVSAMLSDRRFRELVIARQEAMYLMVEERRWSLPRIGSAFGLHHTTILHGHRAHKKRLEAA